MNWLNAKMHSEIVGVNRPLKMCVSIESGGGLLNREKLEPVLKRIALA